MSSQELQDCATTIENAFLSLDHDLSEEALNNKNMRTMAVAMSGNKKNHYNSDFYTKFSNSEIFKNFGFQ